MKIRQGFVSNSSSTSFLLYGIVVEESELFEKYKSELTPEELEEWENGDFDEQYFVEQKIGEGYSVKHPYESDSYYIGKSWDEIKNEQTRKEFTEEIENRLSKLGFNKKCDTWSEAWYDG
jgi:hypothetical protein